MSKCIFPLNSYKHMCLYPIWIIDASGIFSRLTSKKTNISHLNMHKYYIHMVTSQNFSRVFFLVGQTVFICVNMANITTQLFFSVCLYAIIAAENLHAPWTPVVTLDLNTLLSCKSTVYHRYVFSCVFFRWSKPVFICVNTGPLALTKIYFFCLYAISTARIATHLCAVCDKFMLHSPWTPA